MKKVMRFDRTGTMALIVLAGCLVLAGPALGDLSLISTTPADGDTQVDTLMTLIMQFSGPLDTTARENFLTTRNVAQNRFADAEASVLVGSPITEEGASENWQYGFYSTQEETLFGVTRVGETYFTFAMYLGEGDDGPVIQPDRILPEEWIDSDMAADTAEHYVGAQFRNLYGDAEATAFAATFFFTEGKDSQIFPQATQTDTFTAWVFSYTSEAGDDDSHILIDIITGMPIGLPGPGQPTTAHGLGYRYRPGGQSHVCGAFLDASATGLVGFPRGDSHRRSSQR